MVLGIFCVVLCVCCFWFWKMLGCLVIDLLFVDFGEKFLVLFVCLFVSVGCVCLLCW